MPRDLADVLHYFLPELQPDEAATPPVLQAPTGSHDLDGSSPSAGDRRTTPRADPVPPLAILGVPMGDHDVVRAALTWNLAVETARLGGSSLVLAPSKDADSPLWPEPGVGPLGVETCFCPASSLEELYRAAADLAVEHAAQARHGGIVFVRIPSGWLQSEDSFALPFGWLLLLTSSGRRDLREAHDLARGLSKSSPHAEIGVTIHGVRTIAEAKNAFKRLQRASEREPGLSLLSYGLLVDDLHVYRAIAAQRPIGLAHPQAPATRALMDVARLLYEDARSRVLD